MSILRPVLRALACLVVALATTLSPAFAAGPPVDVSVAGSLALGRCIDATHQDMGAGLYAQAPTFLDPVKASDAELACYGLPPRPTGAESLRRWAIAMHTLPLPKTWVHQKPEVIPNTSHFDQSPAPAPAARRPGYWSGAHQTSIWGGWEVFSCAAANNTCPSNIWLIQGQWRVPAPYKQTTHLVSQWVGLGCCGAQNNQALLQAGSYYRYTCTRFCVATAGMFWEAPAFEFGMVLVGPSILVNQTAAAVVYENDQGSSLYETCNESSSQCSWAGPFLYSDVGGATNIANFEEEDTGVVGQSNASNDPPYNTMLWGPQIGPNNQNIVDEVNNPTSIPLQNLASMSEGMNATFHGPPIYMDPFTTVDSNTNFKVCGTAPSTVYYTSDTPQTC